MKSVRGRMALYCFTTFLYAGLFGGVERFSFDRLYPKNCFTKAREDCMQVWAAFEELGGASEPSIRSALLVDAAVGKLSFAKNCIKSCSSKQVSFPSEDLIDLSRIIGTIEEKAKAISRSILGDKGSLVKKMLGKLRAKMQQVMKLG